MRRITLILTAILFATNTMAQNSNEATSTVIQIGDNDSVSSENGALAVMLNGYRFTIGSKSTTKSDETSRTITKEAGSTKRKRAHFGIAGISAPYFNHVALIELGSNMLINNQFNGYTTEQQELLSFTNYKSVICTTNIFTLNAPLTRNNSLVFTTALGFTNENYTFRNNVTVDYIDQRFEPILLSSDVKKSKMRLTYLHIPMLLDWNIDKNFFLSVGATIDILIDSALKYKHPKVKLNNNLPLNPIQIGITGRIGWKRLYAFVNYSPMNIYQSSSNVRSYRLSTGAGFWF